MNNPTQSDKFNSPRFDEMIRERTKRWRDEYDEANRPRLADLVTLTMRHRGDYFGRIYTKTRNSQWRPFSGGGMVTYPVIGRSIRSKTATAVGTRIQTEIEAVQKLPEKQAAAEIARGILKAVRPELRTKQFEQNLSEICQIGRFCFVYSNYLPEGGALVSVPVTAEQVNKFGATEYVCRSCGFLFGPEDLDVDDIADEFKDKDLAEAEDVSSQQSAVGSQPQMLTEGEESPKSKAQSPKPVEDEYLGQLDEEDNLILEHTANLTCPNCQTNTLVLENRAHYEKNNVLTGETQTVDTGRFDARIVSPLLTRIDSYSAIGFDYKKAHWFNYHPLVPAFEVMRLSAKAKEVIETGESKWSESARWHFELNNNTSSSSGYSYRSKNYLFDELVEINCWWISPEACFGWNSPDKYELPEFALDDYGDVVTTGTAFTIEQGESIEQAAVRQSPGDKFRGLLVVMLGDEILGIGNQWFVENWFGVPWQVDSQSFFPQGEERLLKLQDAATNVISLYYSYIRRFGTAPLVVDETMFDMDSVASFNQPGNFIKINKSAMENENRDWRRMIGFLEPGNLSASVAQFIQLMIEIAKEESGVFNETVGNVETTDETLGGRRIALQQSLSLMSPTQAAKAVAFIEQEYQWLELFQRFAPPEAYSLIKGSFEEEWKESDIEAFRECDIRRELFISLVEGTDVPRTQIEMEQRFMVAVNMGLFIEPNPLPVEIRQHIVKSVLQIDFDIQNYSAQKRLAARRYEVIKSELEAIEANEAFIIQPDMSGFPVRTLRPEIVASIVQDPRTMPRQTDQHLVFLEYYTDQLNGLAGARQPDEVLIGALEMQISAHRSILAASQVQANAVAGLAESTASAVGGDGQNQPTASDAQTSAAG